MLNVDDFENSENHWLLFWQGAYLPNCFVGTCIPFSCFQWVHELTTCLVSSHGASSLWTGPVCGRSQLVSGYAPRGLDCVGSAVWDLAVYVDLALEEAWSQETDLAAQPDSFATLALCPPSCWLWVPLCSSFRMLSFLYLGLPTKPLWKIPDLSFTFQHPQERRFDYLRVFCEGITRKGCRGPVAVASVVCIPCGEAAGGDGLDLKLAAGFKSWLHDLTLWTPLCLLVLDRNRQWEMRASRGVVRIEGTHACQVLPWSSDQHIGGAE